MLLPIRFHPEALLELKDGASFYGERFVAQVDEPLTLIGEMPHTWPIWPGRADLHRRVLKKVPYAIVYAVDRMSIFVVAQQPQGSMEEGGSARRVRYVAGSGRKVSQLTGDLDRHLGVATASQTGLQSGLLGTDLGAPVVVGSKLYLYFGDSVSMSRPLLISDRAAPSRIG